MSNKQRVILYLLGTLLSLFSCSCRETINYFVEYRVNDSSMGSIFDADPQVSGGYLMSAHNKYQTVNWGRDALGVAAVANEGFLFSHWEKYIATVTASEFILNPVPIDDGLNSFRNDKQIRSNQVFVAFFTEISK